MKRIALILAISSAMLACNDSEDKEIGTVESVNPSPGTKPDTTTATTPAATNVTNLDTTTRANVPAPDTTQKAATPVTLSNFWALESVDGKVLNPAEFPNGTPYFQFDMKKNKISGHVGCNGVNGSIKKDGNNIVIGNLVATKSTCTAQKFEDKYLKDLSGRTIPYTIDAAGRLILTPGPNSKYIYRKMQ